MNTEINKKRPSLSEVASYKNENVLKSFIKTFGVSTEEASDIFDQLLYMFWLINEMDHEGLKKEGKVFSIDNSLLVIDEMWHTFILFTKEYHNFCFNTFGYFIHHNPLVEAEFEKIHAKFSKMTETEKTEELMNDKRWQYTYVFKKLGKQCFLKWYTEFHQKYTSEVLAELRLQAGRIQALTPTPD